MLPKESKPDERPVVIKPMCDAETMTTPEVQELVGTDRIRRQDSTVRGIVEEPERLEELRGVPIDHIQRTPQIEEVLELNLQSKSYACGISFVSC